MYNGIFTHSDGSNLFTVLGCLHSAKDLVRETVIWNSSGCSSLILFFKCLGYTFFQTFDILKEFELINSMVNCSSVLLEDEEQKKDFIKNWLIDKIEENGILNKDSNLVEIYKSHNLFFNFIMWCRTEEKIIQCNPKTKPDFTLIDCVMASLCCIGTYKTYTIDKYVFSNISIINNIPYEHIFEVKKEVKNLYVFIHTFHNFSHSFKSGPLNKNEDEIILQISESNKIRFRNAIESIQGDNKLDLYVYYTRGNINVEEKKTLFDNGSKQGSSFLEGKSTKIASESFVKLIENQS